MLPEQIIQTRIALAKRGPARTRFDLVIPVLVLAAIMTHTLVPGLALLNAAAPFAGLLAAIFIADDGEMPARLPIPA